MRQHTAFRVGRTTRCRRLSHGVVRNHDIPRLNSRVTIIRIQRDKGRTSPRQGFPAGAGKGVSAVMRDVSDLPGLPGTSAASRPLSWSLRAACVPSGQLAGRPPADAQRPGGAAARGGRPGAAGRAAPSCAGRFRGGPGAAPGGESDSRGAGAGREIGRRRGRQRRPDTLVCVGPRAIRPSGAGPFGGARAIGSAGERLVHTEEVTGSIPVSPTRYKAQVRSSVRGLIPHLRMGPCSVSQRECRRPGGDPAGQV